VIPIIDTHQHLWDLDRFRLPWIEAGSPLARSHRMADYLAEVDGLGVQKTVYMEVDLDPAQQAEEAEFVIQTTRDAANPMAGGVISGRPASPDFCAHVERFSSTPEIKGIRQVLHGGAPAGACLDPAFVKGMQLLGEKGLSFDLCMRPGELGDAAKLAALCPSTQFILDHCGNGDVQSKDRSDWKRGIDLVAAQPNVVCKISGIVVSAKRGAWSAEDLVPIVEYCAGAFGPDRLVFGGDWPVCTLTASLREWITALRQIVSGWSDERQRKLWHENAVRVYRL
jgi:L-fuconolactonase